MASQKYDQLSAFQGAVDVETTRIAGEVQKMLDTIDGGLTPAQADALIAQATPLVANLKAIAAGGAAVIPDPPPPIDPV